MQQGRNTDQRDRLRSDSGSYDPLTGSGLSYLRVHDEKSGRLNPSPIKTLWGAIGPRFIYNHSGCDVLAFYDYAIACYVFLILSSLISLFCTIACLFFFLTFGRSSDLKPAIVAPVGIGPRRHLYTFHIMPAPLALHIFLFLPGLPWAFPGKQKKPLFPGLLTVSIYYLKHASGDYFFRLLLSVQTPILKAFKHAGALSGPPSKKILSKSC